MSIYGYLHTMSLPDLLQWASVNKKSGVLEVERNKIRRRISLLDGRIVACSTDDPSSRMGQFLLSRGSITSLQLRQALARQETTGQNLGAILVGMGALTREDLERQVAEKAEETIFGLFDWPDAVFRFYHTAPHDPSLVEVNLGVEDVLLRGIQRHDELQRMRRIFRHSGLVLQRTSRAVPPGIPSNTMAQRVLESVDGVRTLAEILLHTHASEFLVVKFLFTLFRAGIVAMKEERAPDSDAQTILDSGELDSGLPGDPSPKEEAETVSESEERDRQVEVAMQHIARAEFLEALDILNTSYRANPGDNHLRELVTKAESGFLAAARGGEMRATAVPVPRPDAVQLAQAANVQPSELFLLSMIDGQQDIQSLVWVAPMREVDVLIGLRRLVNEGAIELREADAASTGKRSVPKVQWILTDRFSG